MKEPCQPGDIFGIQNPRILVCFKCFWVLFQSGQSVCGFRIELDLRSMHTAPRAVLPALPRGLVPRWGRWPGHPAAV